MDLQIYFTYMYTTIQLIDSTIRRLNITLGGVQIGLQQLYGIACLAAIFKTLLGRDEFDLGGDDIIDI